MKNNLNDIIKDSPIFGNQFKFRPELELRDKLLSWCDENINKCINNNENLMQANGLDWSIFFVPDTILAVTFVFKNDSDKFANSHIFEILGYGKHDN